jgi:siderophore synthetase component
MATDHFELFRKFGLTDTEKKYIGWAHAWNIPEGDIERLFQESRFSSYTRLMNCFIREYAEDVAMIYDEDTVVLGNPPSLRVPTLHALPLRTYIFADYPSQGERSERLAAPRSIVRALADLDADAKSNWSLLEEEYVLSCSQLLLAYLLRAKHAKIAGPQYLFSSSYQDADQALVFFEQWCAEGHLLHPTPKTKLGITPENLVRYMPEAGDPVPLADYASW